MKKLLSFVLAVLMLFGIASCGKKDSDKADKASETTTVPVKLISSESGRLSAIEPPEGWKLEESSAEDQLVYSKVSDDESSETSLYDNRLWINYDEFNTPDEMIEKQESIKNESNMPYTVENKKIGGVDFRYIKPESGYGILFGTIDGVTVCVSIDNSINVDDTAVTDIISSIKVTPDK